MLCLISSKLVYLAMLILVPLINVPSYTYRLQRHQFNYCFVIIYIIYFSDSVCDTEFATNMTFKVVTAILNFYIPTTLIIFLYVRIFLAIKSRSRDIVRFGAYTASGGSVVSNNGAKRSAKNIAKKPSKCSTNIVGGRVGAISLKESRTGNMIWKNFKRIWTIIRLTRATDSTQNKRQFIRL